MSSQQHSTKDSHNILICLLLLIPLSTSHLLATIAGCGMCDGSAAVKANLNYPNWVHVDASANVFISDLFNNRVRKVSPSGIITTIAGSGVFGYSGDGGLAIKATLNYPKGVFADELGNVFIVDSSNFCVRKVFPHGIIMTIAGNGTSGQPSPISTAQLKSPNCVYVDLSGSVYICDAHRIGKIFPNGTMVTIAGNETAGFAGDGGLATKALLNFPQGLIIDNLGNILIADRNNHVIRKIFPNNTITTIAGTPGVFGPGGDGGLAKNAEFYFPSAVALDGSGNILIADRTNYRVRKVLLNGTIITVAGNGVMGYSGDGGPATAAKLGPVHSISVDSQGNIYTAERENNRIRKIFVNGTIITFAGSDAFSGDGIATDVQLNNPGAVYIDDSGTLFLTDHNNHRIRQVYRNGSIVTIAGNGTAGFNGDGHVSRVLLNGPFDITGDTKGNLLFTDYYNHCVRKLFSNGTIVTIAGNGTAGYSGDGGPAIRAQFNTVSGLFLDSVGNLFVADQLNHAVRKIFPNGTITTVAGTGVAGVSVDGGTATSAQLSSPRSVYVNSLGHLFIANQNINNIRVVFPNGTISTFAGNGNLGYSGDGGPATHATLNKPVGVTGDSAGNIFISDTLNHRIRKVLPNGTITTIAGNGMSGYYGDEGLAVNGMLNAPRTVFVNKLGEIYVADYGNNRIRVLSCVAQTETNSCVVDPECRTSLCMFS